MFTFFHRTPVIHLDCFTYMGHIHELTPIVSAAKAAPAWWKNLDTGHMSYDWKYFSPPRKTLTMKSCHGFVELYKRGVILENWCDLRLQVTDAGFKYMHSSGEKPSEHPRFQLGEGFKNFYHLKLASPWIFREKQGIKFHFNGAMWSLEDYNIRVVPGVVDYRSNGYTNVNIMIPRDPIEYTIPVGQPLVHIMPLSDKKLKVKNHLISRLEYDTMCRHSASYYSGWKAVNKLLQRNDSRKSGCPFGFGD